MSCSLHSFLLLPHWDLVQDLVQQAKLERAEELRTQSELCSRNAAERAQRRYEKHFKICRDSLKQIVDLATKVGEYRLLTAGKYVTFKVCRRNMQIVFGYLLVVLLTGFRYFLFYSQILGYVCLFFMHLFMTIRVKNWFLLKETAEKNNNYKKRTDLA